MNGAHDLGGMHGFGPVVIEPDEPVFHAEWERRTFALNLAMGAWRKWNIDMWRFAREPMPAAEYLATSYYEHWLWGLERLLEQHGFVAQGELDRRVFRHAPSGPTSAEPLSGSLRRQDVSRLVQNRRGARRDDPVSPTFKAGDQVVARNMNPPGHTRIPRYVRGRHGVIHHDHGVFSFPDSSAAGFGSKPQHVYSVRFGARELWGPDGDARDAVHVDLWEDYLEPASRAARRETSGPSLTSSALAPADHR